MNIEKAQQINKEFDITRLIAEFNTQHMEHVKVPFYGIIIMLIFERKDTELIERQIGHLDEFLLSGMVPNKLGDTTKYDFKLSPMITVLSLKSPLLEMLDMVEILEIEVEKLPNGLSQVAILNMI